MLYSVTSPYYRQFLSSTVNKYLSPPLRKYQKSLEKQAASTPALEQRGNVNPTSVGV